MADFLPAYEQAILLEGGYKLHEVQGDRGGQTYAGIARKRWPQWPGWAEIDAGRQPATAMVRAFYHANFWLRFRVDGIADQEVAECLFLGAINAEASVKLWQVVVGVTPDGVVGQKTLAAINAAPRENLLPLVTLAKITRYRDICMRDRTQTKFLLGWINRALAEAACPST